MGGGKFCSVTLLTPPFLDHRTRSRLYPPLFFHQGLVKERGNGTPYRTGIRTVTSNVVINNDPCLLESCKSLDVTSGTVTKVSLSDGQKFAVKGKKTPKMTKMKWIFLLIQSVSPMFGVKEKGLSMLNLYNCKQRSGS